MVSRPKPAMDARSENHDPTSPTEHPYRGARPWFCATIVGLLLAVTAGSGYWSYRQMEHCRLVAEKAQSGANVLVDFILTDLRDQLEPMGRVDLLELPARKAWQYLESLPPDDDSPEYRQRRAVALDNIGEVLSLRGELRDAAQAFRQSLQISETLAHQDPANSAWQRGLAIGYSKVADVQKELGHFAEALATQRKALEIIDRLAQQSPDDKERQYDLSLAHERVGVVLEAQGEFPDALKSYQARQIIISSLHTLEPDRTDWQRDLAVSYGTIGNVLDALGDADGALVAYRTFAELAEQLTKQDPDQPDWQRHFAISQEKIGDILAARADLNGAAAAYQRFADISSRLAAMDVQNIQLQRDLAAARARLAVVREKAGKLGDATELQHTSADALAAIAAKLGTEAAQREAGRAFGKLAWFQLLQRQPQKAADTAKRASKLAPDDLRVDLVHAHALLLCGRVAEAEKIYRHHLGTSIDGKRSWSAAVAEDFRTLMAKAIVHPDMKRIENALKPRS